MKLVILANERDWCESAPIYVEYPSIPTLEARIEEMVTNCIANNPTPAAIIGHITQHNKFYVSGTLLNCCDFIRIVPVGYTAGYMYTYHKPTIVTLTQYFKNMCKRDPNNLSTSWDHKITSVKEL